MSEDPGPAGEAERIEESGGGVVAFSAEQVRDLLILLNNPTVWVVMALTGFSLEVTIQKLTQKSAVAVVMDDYLFRTILRPIAVSIFIGGLNAIDEFILIVFGTDRQVGIVEGARPGLADVPILFARPIIQTFLTVGLLVFNTVDLFNRGLAQDLAGIGLAAPAWVNLIWITELTVIGAFLWVAISFIPVFDVRGILLSLTALPRRALRRLL